MRNTFRALELVAILGSTSEPARQLMIKGSISRPHSDTSFWCTVHPLFLQFLAESIDSYLPEWMRLILLRSRPLFATTALAFIQAHPLPVTMSTIAYMDTLAADLAKAFAVAKRDHWLWFLAGQVCLFLCSNCVVDRKSYLVHGHYARLKETKPFDLYLDCDNETVTSGDTWLSRSELPSPSEDMLLHLTLSGNKTFRALTDFDGKSLSFREALATVESLDEVIGYEDFKHYPFKSTVKRVEGVVALGNLVAGAIVLASHTGEFAGVRFGSFFFFFFGTDVRIGRERSLT